VSDYLWDRSGPPDEDVVRLERLLGELRSTPPVPQWRSAAARGPVFLALAASLCVACGAALWVARAHDEPAWAVVSVSGRPEAGGAVVSGTGRLAAGEWLETDAHDTASVAVADIGRLDVEPDTRLRVVESSRGRHRVEMPRGTVHALIWAPPGEFVVDTPATTAVDLGCAYTLHVDPSGAGVIDVETGWVGFTFHGREAFIPAGARCLTRPRVGPGTPFYADMDEQSRHALEVLDFGDGSPASRSNALATVLRSARREDAITLWHLLPRVPIADRDAVFDRLARLVPPPAGVTREGIREGDTAMRDRWWDALDLGTAGWWRMWERRWR